MTRHEYMKMCRAGCGFYVAEYIKDGMCWPCFQQFAAFAREQKLRLRHIGGMSVLDFSDPNTAVAYDTWITQRK